MLLEPYNQTDNPECKSRPDSGLSAITELDPGYITGIYSNPSGNNVLFIAMSYTQILYKYIYI